MTANQASLARTGLPAPQATSAVSISPILGKGISSPASGARRTETSS